MNGNCGSLVMPCAELIELSMTMGDEAEKNGSMSTKFLQIYFLISKKSIIDTHIRVRTTDITNDSKIRQIVLPVRYKVVSNTRYTQKTHRHRDLNYFIFEIFRRFGQKRPFSAKNLRQK